MNLSRRGFLKTLGLFTILVPTVGKSIWQVTKPPVLVPGFDDWRQEDIEKYARLPYYFAQQQRQAQQDYAAWLRICEPQIWNPDCGRIARRVLVQDHEGHLITT